jgi:hypothetical protein
MWEMWNALWRVGGGAKSPDTDTTTTTTTATSHDVYTADTADTAGPRACAWNERRADLGMEPIAHGTRATENIWSPKREPSRNNGFHLANVKYRSAGLSAMPTTSSAAALHLEALVHPALWTHPNPRRVVILTHENDDRGDDDDDDGVLCEVLKHATVQQVQVVHLTTAIPLKEANVNVPNDSFGTMNGPHRHDTARILDKQLYRYKQQKQFHWQTASNPSCRNDPRVVAMTDPNDQTPWGLPASMDHSIDVVLVVEQLYVLAYVGNAAAVLLF